MTVVSCEPLCDAATSAGESETQPPFTTAEVSELTMESEYPAKRLAVQQEVGLIM